MPVSTSAMRTSNSASQQAGHGNGCDHLCSGSGKGCSLAFLAMTEQYSHLIPGQKRLNVERMIKAHEEAVKGK